MPRTTDMETSAERLPELTEMEMYTKRSPWRRAQSGRRSECASLSPLVQGRSPLQIFFATLFNCPAGSDPEPSGKGSASMECMRVHSSMDAEKTSAFVQTIGANGCLFSRASRASYTSGAM